MKTSVEAELLKVKLKGKLQEVGAQAEAILTALINLVDQNGQLERRAVKLEAFVREIASASCVDTSDWPLAARRFLEEL